MKVSSVEHVAGVGEDQRIVGHRIHLAAQDVRCEAHGVVRRTHHLGLAAQAVRVLDPSCLGARGTEIAALQQ